MATRKASKDDGSAADTATCEVCNLEAPIHVAPDKVPRIGDHGQCQGQGRRCDGQ